MLAQVVEFIEATALEILGAGDGFEQHLRSLIADVSRLPVNLTRREFRRRPDSRLSGL